MANSAYSSEWLEPPVGPFHSTLKVETVGVPQGTLSNVDRSEYTFKVPDLGRYNSSQRMMIDNNNSSLMPSDQQLIEPFIGNDFSKDRSSIAENNQINMDDFSQPIDEPKVGMLQNETLTPLNNSEADSPFSQNLPDPMIYDDSSYPPEWAQPNPLRGQFQNKMNTFMPPTNNSGFDMPFAPQMMPWQNNQNNTNNTNGYR